MIAIGCNR